MNLYKIKAEDWKTVFGSHDLPDESDQIETDFVCIAQTPSCDAFLLLSKTEHNEEEVELLDSEKNQTFKKIIKILVFCNLGRVLAIRK